MRPLLRSNTSSISSGERAALPPPPELVDAWLLSPARTMPEVTAVVSCPVSEPAPVPILASDAEREHSIALLREAVGEGRLTLEEFSDRVGLAQAARTDQELAHLARDLPADPGTAGVAVPSDEHRAFCSHLVRSGLWSLPAHSSWRSIFGTIDLDLRQARLAGSETVLEVYNLLGTVTVLVPEGVEVIVRGGGMFASQKIESPGRSPIAGAPRLTIDTRGPGGTLHVRTRPNPTLMQAITDALSQRTTGGASGPGS